MFEIEMLPAAHGDCLWLTYGPAERPRHVLIDGGPEATAPLLQQRIQKEIARAGSLHLELVVVTHIDADHIQGILALLEAPPEGLTIGDVWFNGYHHLQSSSLLGGVDGERLSAALSREGSPPWNEAFGGEAVVVPAVGALPERSLAGGLHLTLLSPTRKELTALAPVWAAEVRKAGLEPGVGVRQPDHPDLLGRKDSWPPNIPVLAQQSATSDGSKSNASSIAFIAEYDGRRCLFGADAKPGVLVAGLQRLAGSKVRLDAIKLPHHGSAVNLNKTLLSLIECGTYLISTSGAIFAHPDHAALARVLTYGGPAPRLVFNYRSLTTSDWEKLHRLPGVPSGAEVELPEADKPGAVVPL